MSIVTGLLIYLAHVFVLWYFLEHVFPERRVKSSHVIAGYGVLWLLGAAAFVIFQNYLVQFLIMAVLTIILALILYSNKVWYIIITVIAYYAVLAFLVTAGQFFFELLHVDTGAEMSADFSLLSYSSFIQMIQLFLVHLFLVLTSKLYTQGSLVQALPLIMVQLICIVVGFLNIYDQRWQKGLADSNAIINLLLLCVNITICAYIEIVKGYFENRERIKVAESRLRLQREHYNNMLVYQEDTRKLWHDIGKYSAAVNALVDANNSEAAEKARQDLEDRIHDASSVIDVDNPVINSILSYGLRKCRENNIEFAPKAWVAKELDIPASDLYIIIGNTIDNAVEACMSLEGEERRIDISLVQKNHVLMYEITNKIPENAPAKTRKVHGYGLQNVKSCVESNKGNMTIDNSAGIYKVNIQLNV